MGVFRLPLLLLLMSTGVGAETPDSLASRLDEVVVEGVGGRQLRLSADGNLKINLNSLMRGMRSLGEADPLALLKRAGGVSSVGDYGSGVVIQGNAPWQSIYRINGAPVYFPYRFGGVFSTFNTAHFSSLSISRYVRDASAPNRLGAVIDLAPALQFSRPISVSANVGLLASSATAKLSAGGRFALTLSGRISYVDELYGRLIKNNDNSLSYRFSDANVSAGWKINGLQILSADFFYNSDKIFAGNGNYAMDTRMRWSNCVGSLKWAYAGAHAAEVAAFYSSQTSTLSVAFPQYDIHAPAELRSYGATAKMIALNGWGFIPTVNVGAEVTAYAITPLYASVGGELERLGTASRKQNPLSGRVYADAKFRPLGLFGFEAGVSVSAFGRFYSIDPRIGAEFHFCGNTWSIGLGRYTQYLHNVGFSEIGLASNFWYGATSEVKPQHSIDFSVAWTKSLFGNQLQLNIAAYYKKVKSQSEYVGSVLDIIDNDYDINRHIIIADGYNSGVEAGIQKTFGALTGALSYSFGRAMRHHNDITFRSINDMGHQFKVDAEYVFNQHWSVAAAFTYGSGRVYTPTRYIYLIAGRIITEYGERNSGRLPDYQRLDLSASYKCTTRKVNHMVNLSLINAYGHKNVEAQYFSIDTETMRYRLLRSNSLYRFLPSLSYSIDF